ncbi:MAG: glycosyltransferase family 39 protein [Solirubrobacteraceae bacterium]
MATDVEIPRPAGLARREARLFWSHWSAEAWASVVVGVLFVAATCWWLSRDHSIPVYDAGLHLGSAIDAYRALSMGHLLNAFTESTPYPPLTYLVGALGIFVGGVDVAPPIIAQDVIFVTLLALGCYNVGRLAFGRLAGLLAVVFALGSPLIIEESHEFMLDAPEAAMVAVAVWAILATERFSRPRVSALAGIAVGLGMLSKETFVFFVAGVALVTAMRGGRQAWRGITVFAALALVIALPWYLYELSTIHGLANEALGSSGQLSSLKIFPGTAPPRLSTANLEWYFWSVLNWQLFLPLFSFSVVGWIWTMAGFARRRPVSGFAPELAAGALISWAALTETYIHDVRYAIPLTVYLAVFGAGWITRLPSKPRTATAILLLLIALANSLGVGYGIGPPVATAPSNATYEQQPGRVTLYANYGLWVGPPTRDGDLLGLLRALRRNGVQAVRWYSEREDEIEFSFPGITVLAQIADLEVLSENIDPFRSSRHYAFLRHGEPEPGLPTPCIVLGDGAGVWVHLGGTRGVKTWSYCPLRFS